MRPGPLARGSVKRSSRSIDASSSAANTPYAMPTPPTAIRIPPRAGPVTALND